MNLNKQSNYLIGLFEHRLHNCVHHNYSIEVSRVFDYSLGFDYFVESFEPLGSTRRLLDRLFNITAMVATTTSLVQ